MGPRASEGKRQGMRIRYRQAPRKLMYTYKLLAIHYGFSPRLLGVMRSEPIRPAPSASETDYNELGDLSHEHTSGEHKTAQNHVDDLEGDVEMQNSRKVHAEALDLNHYRVVSEVWHYSSMDWGSKCKCL